MQREFEYNGDLRTKSGLFEDWFSKSWGYGTNHLKTRTLKIWFLTTWQPCVWISNGQAS